MFLGLSHSTGNDTYIQEEVDTVLRIVTDNSSLQRPIFWASYKQMKWTDYDSGFKYSLLQKAKIRKTCWNKASRTCFSIAFSNMKSWSTESPNLRSFRPFTEHVSITLSTNCQQFVALSSQQNRVQLDDYHEKKSFYIYVQRGTYSFYRNAKDCRFLESKSWVQIFRALWLHTNKTGCLSETSYSHLAEAKSGLAQNFLYLHSSHICWFS